MVIPVGRLGHSIDIMTCSWVRLSSVVLVPAASSHLGRMGVAHQAVATLVVGLRVNRHSVRVVFAKVCVAAVVASSGCGAAIEQCPVYCFHYAGKCTKVNILQSIVMCVLQLRWCQY